MSILYLTAKGKSIKKSLGAVITLVSFFMLLMISLPGAVLASGIGDVVTQVAGANYSSPEFEFSSESETGLDIKMHLAMGGYGSGYGGLTVLGPADKAGMQALLNYVDTQTSHTSIDTQKMKGCEVRRYTLYEGAGVGVVLPDYLITVEFYETGNSKEADIQAALRMAQQTLDGLERAGLLSQAAPDIIEEQPQEAGTEQENKPVAAGQVGTPLDEPTAVSDTMNIAGVYNGATVPTTFTINSPHLVTEIHDYHWNDAQGKTPGTIGLQDQNGKMYGPWQAIGTPGQGGVPDANWLVYPNVIIPAGTYTIIDSDPGTWSQNSQSGGKGMGYVKATPHFEVEPGPAGVTEGPVTRDWDYPPCDCESPAGVGSVGNIPGPSNTTEAVTGVVVPGLIATALGALGGLGGGGFIPPAGGTPLHPTGGGPLPGTGGIPGTGGVAPGMTQATSHLGRRGKEEIFVDTVGMYEGSVVPGQVPDEGGILIDPAADAGILTAASLGRDMTADSGLLIDGPEEAGIFIDNGPLIDGPEEAGIFIDESLLIDGAEEEAIFVQSGKGPIMDASPVKGGIDDGGIFIDGPEEAAEIISSETDILIDTAQEEPGVRSAEAEMFADGSEGEILIDTSAVEGKPGDETGIGLEDSIYDQAGYDQEGYNREGFDQDGYNREGFNAEGYDKEGFNQEGFDAEGYDKAGYDEEGFDRDGRNSADYDREGYNSQGFDKDGFDREGFDKNGYDQAGFDKEGYDKKGFDQSGFDKDGFDAEGFDSEGFDKSGFNAQGYDKEGFDQLGFDQEGFDKNGFDAQGFDRNGFDQEGFNKEGFDQAGFDRNGFDRNGFDEEGFNEAGFNENGYNREGFDAGGFDREGYNAKGFDKEGFDREGFDKEGFSKEGLDREGFDKNGFDANGYDREGFNKAGYDQDGYGRNGFDAEGFDRDGFNVNGYDRLGYDRQGFDAQGYNKNGFDKAGFNQEGFDRDGYDKNGFNKSGWDREGYDKNGYDADGYNRDGYNREGQSQEGYDADGYDKKGFNEHGYDRDGYDRDGFNFEGYSRSGRDPWGYDKQGYGKDGYHWSGYDADGYDRNGRHWSESPTAPSSGSSFGPDSPFNVSTDGPYTYRTPFTEGPINLGKSVSTTDQSPAIYQGDDYGNLPDAAGSTKPPLGQPYPKTVEKYGAKTWGDTIPDEPEHTAIPIPKDSGAIGPEDPMNTLKNHGIDQDAPAAPEGQTGSGLSIPDEDLPVGAEIPDPDMKIPVDMPPVTGPRHGDTITLPGKDGHEYVLDYNEKTGEWENLLTGGKVRNEDLGSYIDDFNRWQDDVAEDLRRSALDLEKMANREDASSRAIDEAMSKLKQLDQMEIAAEKYGIGQHGGPGDISKAIQDLRADMAAGKNIDDARMEQLKNIIKNRVAGVSTGDSGTRYEEDWFKNLGFALEANMATAKEVVTGQRADGSISWKGMAARVIMTTATGGVPGKIIDGSLTVAEAMTRIQESVDQGETSFRAISKAVGILVLGEQAGYLAGKGMGALNKSMLERFPAFTNKAADFVEKAILKGSRLNQQLSRKLGLISQESAESALNAIKKRLGELGSEQASDKFIKQAVGRQGAAAGGKAATSGARAASKTTQAAGKTTQAAGKTTQAAGKTTQAAGKTTQAAGKTSQVAKPTGKPTLKTVSAETPGLKIDKNSFKEAGLPPDLRGMPARDQKAVQTVCDKYGVKAHMRPTNPESRVWLESGKAHPKPEMLKAKTINNLDVELGYPKENIGTVGCRRPDPLPASKPSSMTDAHWNSLQKRHTQRMTEFTDQAAKLKHLEKQGKIVWDQKTGIIYNKQTMKPYCGDHDTFALVDAVSGKPVSPRVNEQINREMQSLGATQHPEHVGWDYSGLSDKVPDGAVPGAQSPREIAEAIDQKILGGHGEGGEALNTYDPLRGEKGGWTTNWWKGGTRA